MLDLPEWKMPFVRHIRFAKGDYRDVVVGTQCFDLGSDVSLRNLGKVPHDIHDARLLCFCHLLVLLRCAITQSQRSRKSLCPAEHRTYVPRLHVKVLSPLNTRQCSARCEDY